MSKSITVEVSVSTLKTIGVTMAVVAVVHDVRTEIITELGERSSAGSLADRKEGRGALVADGDRGLPRATEHRPRSAGVGPSRPRRLRRHRTSFSSGERRAH